MDQIKTMISENRINSTNTTSSIRNATKYPDRVGETKFTSFFYNGKYHMVPENFKLPVLDATLMFQLYYFGNSEFRIRPYRHYEEFKSSFNKEDRRVLSKSKKIFAEIEKLAMQENYFEEGATKFIDVKDRNISIGIFNNGYKLFLKSIYTNNPLNANPAITTLYKRLILMAEGK